MKKSIFLFFAAILCAIGMNAKTTATVYYSIPASTVGCYTVKCYYNFGYEQKGLVEMTKENKTSNGNLIYSIKLTADHDNVDELLFQLFDGNTWKSQKTAMSGWTALANNSGKMYNHSTSKWVSYTTDPSYTVYYVDQNNWGSNIRAYAWNSDCDKNQNWSGASMTSTGKKYNGKNIYSITFEKRYNNIIFSEKGENQTNDLKLGTTNAGKMFTHASKTGDWIAYTYDVKVTFDANGHGTAPEAQTVLNGNKITEPTAPIEDGYTFGGWYKEAECTNKWNFETDVLNDDITLYAKWSEITHTVTFANDGNGTTNKTGAIEVGVITGIAIDATPNTDYEFNVWESSNGGTFATTAAEASNTFYPTANTTLTATFRSIAVNALLVVAGENITSVTGSTKPVTLGSSYPISATFPTGYKFHQWTADPSENAEFEKASNASTMVKVLNGSVTVIASATEILAELTTDNSFDAGTPTLAVPTTTEEKIGVATTAKITATEAPSGYTFVGWTLTNCERTDGGADNATSITVRSNGDSKAATVVANYAEDLTTSWVLKGSFVDDFATAYDFTKKSGESTGKVAYVSIDLDAHKEYKFKVVENGSTWYGNNNSDEEWWIKQTSEDWSFYSDAGNCHMKTGLAGTYTFKIDYSGTNPIKVSIYFPEIYAIVGTFNEWKEDANKLTFDGNIGTTTINLEASATNYEFKVIDNAVHGGIVNKTITQTENDLAITVGGGDNIKLTANANPKGNYIFTYNKSTKKLSVTYPTVYTIKVEAENGTVEGAGKYAEGATVTLTPTANEGYHFEKWSNGSTDNPLTITVTEDVKIQAIFAINTYTVTATATEGGTVTGADTYKHGEEVTLTATANPGYKFTGWSDGETDNPYSFTITEDVTLTANFEKETYTRTVSADYYGTICLPFGSSEYNGAEFYEVSYVIVGKGLWLDQLEDNAQLEAGKPYIFKATADKLVVVSDGKTAANPIAGANGLTGTFTDIAAGGDLEGHYIIADNQVWVAGTDATLPANRAYINAEDVPTTPQAQLPGRRRVCMGENAATGLDNITNSENTTIKLIENGQLIIIRNGEKFNAQGVRF